MKDSVLAFLRAVFWGSFAGGGPFLILTVPIALHSSDWSQPDVIWLAVMPMVIAVAVVALAATFLGLPLTAWLSHQKDEEAVSYGIAGFGFGVLLPIVLVLALTGSWLAGAFFAIPGALAGTITGAIWGRYRERVADRRTQS